MFIVILLIIGKNVVVVVVLEVILVKKMIIKVIMIMMNKIGKCEKLEIKCLIYKFNLVLENCAFKVNLLLNKSNIF